MSKTENHANGPGEVRPLHSLCALLEQRGIRYLIHGGWAAEYYLQRERPHRDIDLASPATERLKYLECFPAADDLRSRSKIKFLYEGIPVEVTLTPPPRGGRLTVPYKNRTLRVPAKFAEPVLGSIRGRTCPLLPCAMICLNTLTRAGGRIDETSTYNEDFQALMATLTPAEREEIEQLCRQPERLLDRLARFFRR